MSKQLRELQTKKAELLTQARAITSPADAEGREMTEDESIAYATCEKKINITSAALEREISLIAQEAQGAIVAQSLGNYSPPTAISTHGYGEPQAANDKTHGFRNVGDFAKAIFSASGAVRHGGDIDRRLMIGAALGSTYANETSGADGGFLIPPAISTELFSLSLEGDALLPLTANVNIEGNGMSFPGSESTPWGATGVKAYWQGEAAAGTATKPNYNNLELKLHKLMALVPVTNELLSDVSALNSYLPSEMSSAIRWKTNDAILNGTGAGQPTGCLISGAALTIAKETAQSTLTLLPVNLTKMIAALPPGSYANAVWMMNNDVLPYLWTLNTTNGFPVYLPSTKESPYGLLLGRPIMISQLANTFSSAGDIVLVDLKYYRTTTKAAGIETATSMHLYFDQDVTAFRATFRMDGKSKISAAITPNKGSNKMSPFVLLGAR